MSGGGKYFILEGQRRPLKVRTEENKRTFSVTAREKYALEKRECVRKGVKERV